MKIVSFKVFEGRNIYSHKKCIRLNLDLEGYSNILSKEIYNLNDSIVFMLPQLAKHICRIDDDRKFTKILAEGSYLIYIIEHIILALHKMLGMETSYVETKGICGGNNYVIYQYEYKNTGIEAANIAVHLVNSLISKNSFDLNLHLIRLKEILSSEQLGLSTLNICEEAEKRGIPILPIGGNGIFQLGYGKYSNIIQSTLSCNTSAIAVDIAQDKLLTKEILALQCIPVASGMKVGVMNDCLLKARELGYPVVLKPKFRNQGKGVINNIKNEEELLSSYKLLVKSYEDIIVEKYILGKGYRVCCIYGDVVSVLERNSTLSTDGFSIDCTHLICEENIEICKRAANAIGLDICSIDLLCEDISKPLDQGGVVIKVNAEPNIDSHRNVEAHIVNKLFKDMPKNIPLVAVTGTNGKTTTTRLIAHILKTAGYTVGMTTTSGIYIDGKCIFKGDTTGPKSALAVLMNKSVDAAVLETARGGIIRRGLGYDLADVAVITNITEDHLGIDGVETIEDLAKVKALVGESVKKNGYVVINGDDNMSVSILHRLKSNLIIFSNDKNNVVMRTNVKNGGYGVYVDDGNIIIQKGASFEKLMEVKSIGITMKGIIRYNIENAMAVCAASVALGVSYDIIRQGLASFSSNKDQNPGRFNIYFVNNVMVVLDYGHNIEGYKGVLDALNNIQHNRLIAVIGVPGDRLTSDILEVGKCAGENFDYIFIKEDQNRRGRDIGEVADILEKGVLMSKFNKINVEKVLDETKAFKTALDVAEVDDIVIVFFDKEEPLIDVMKKKINQQMYETTLLVKS